MTSRLTLRTSEVATQLGVGKSTVARWVAAGVLPHHKVGGVVLIRPADVDLFLEAHREGDDLASRRARTRRA